MNNIIKDIIRLNSEITENEYKSRNKILLFINKKKANRSRKKLLSLITKFRKSEFIFSKQDLVELFEYIIVYYPPNGEYKNIKVCKQDQLLNIETFIIKDSWKIIIKIDRRLNNFEVVAHDYDIGGINSDGISININQLHSNKQQYEKILIIINQELKDLECDFLEETIKSFM